MKSPKNKKIPGKISLAALLFWAALCIPAIPAIFAAAQNAGYDLYTSQMAYTPTHRSLLRQIASDFLTYPFALVRWPLNHTIDFIEDNRLPQKVRFVFEKLEDQGITPEIGVEIWGAGFNILRLLHIENKLPDNVMAKGWLHYGPELSFKTGVKAGIEPASGKGFHAFGLADFEKRFEESFYGFGSNTSKGDEAEYETKTTTLEAHAGYTLESFWRLNSRFAYRNIDISDSDDEDKISQIFPSQRIPGLRGDKILTLGTEISWEPDKNRRALTTPGKLRLGFDYNEGVDGSDARYLKFVTEAAKNFSLGSNREFGIHFYGEHNAGLNGKEIPFHQMPRLGGFGGFPYNSHTHRGYERGRYTDETALLLNLEYRYRIYEYRQWTLSHAVFLDEGQTFKKFSSFQFKDFKESYGTGFRLGYMERVMFDFEIAHANEGTEFYFKNRRPF